VADESKSEKRRLTRTVARVPATFVAGDTCGNGHIKNLSRDGLFIRTETLPTKGDSIEVIFFLQNGNKLEIGGTVRWTTAQLAQAEQATPGFGMHIDEQSNAYLEFYEQLLAG